LNGVCGDHLVDTDNPLAIPMQLRVFLPPEPGSPPARQSPDQSIALELELEPEPQLRPVQIYPTPMALSDPDFQPTDRLLIMVHGLCMNDRQWNREQHNHADMLARDFGYTPVYLRYNTGQHISSNGREFAGQLAELLTLWPVPIESISIIGHSMGGLVTRSALRLAQAEQRDWLKKVDKVVYLGSPHHGAALERGGFRLDQSIARSPYTAPLTALSRMRSTGITDLRHGNTLDADWQGYDPHNDDSDHRQPAPLVSGIEHFAIAATLSKQSGDKIGKLLGDGLVHPSSATGRHADPEHVLGFAKDNTRIFYDLGHLGLLNDVRVAELLGRWLG
jgi:pimeloyl-ACP methyl ester carboxylesterase